MSSPYYVQIMDQLTWVDYVTTAVGVIGAVVAVLSAWRARHARRDAAAASTRAEEHEQSALRFAEDANASRTKAGTALAEIAEVLRDQAQPVQDWVPASQGGAHHVWDVTNRTGRPVFAQLTFPALRPGQVLKALGQMPELFGQYLEPGESLGFTWERQGPGGGSRVALVDVVWSDPTVQKEGLVRHLRITWPES